jgi:uncharacterized membrane protein required for colicin V production
MAAFDLAVAAILALSVLFAVLRGFVRSRFRSAPG